MNKVQLADRVLDGINRRQSKVVLRRRTAHEAEIHQLRHERAETEQRLLDKRFFAAKSFLKGQGIEIGALHRPLVTPPDVTVRYVDRYGVDDLRAHYPELAELPLVPVDIVDDGETLSTIKRASQNFVIANHFLEHCQDPIRTLENMINSLRPDGIIYMAIPDKRFTFDEKRPVTPFEHLLRDYEEGPEWSKQQHFEEWVELVKGVRGKAEAAKRTQELIDEDYSIHFHVWTQLDLLDFFSRLQRELNFAINFELIAQNNEEVIVILRHSKAS